MNAIELVATMLRYRVASLLLPFFILAPALHGHLELRWQYAAGLLALGCSYVVATCLNDVFDLDIDRVNHPAAPDRPLVTGEATPHQLIAVAVVVAVTALIASAATSWTCLGLIAVSLLLNAAYSIPPIRLCARPLAAPVVLAFAYVALPYGIGLAAAGLAAGEPDLRIVVCFFVLFIGRMVLKDFRDREGDAAFGKRTFLLTYGKPATLGLTFLCLVAGNALLVAGIAGGPAFVVVVESYFLGIGFQLYRLWHAGDPSSERVAIALGARLGNALVLTVLGVALLRPAGASPGDQAVFVVAFAALFWFTFAYVILRPQQALAAYRG